LFFDNASGIEGLSGTGFFYKNTLYEKQEAEVCHENKNIFATSLETKRKTYSTTTAVVISVILVHQNQFKIIPVHSLDVVCAAISNCNMVFFKKHTGSTNENKF